ncbi:MAG: arginine repressor [Acidobacteria bacterium]|nr:MAG: arginine repressor [Acidobacteriota bacterium]
MAMSTKLRRQKLILDLIAERPIASQHDLLKRLNASGFAATQATISRDLKDLGVVKRAADGAYQHPGSDSAASPQAAITALARAMDQYLLRIERSQQLVVVGTGRAQAQPLAEAIDRAALPEVVGTIAGNNTILVVSRDVETAAALVKRLQALLARDTLP